jgi:acyl carrier protein
MKPHFAAVTEAIRLVLDFQSTDRLQEETHLESDLGMDSGLMLELVMQLEETVPGLVIDQASISHDQFRTVATVCDYVAAHIKASEPA